ncbi:unnamed protein product [Gulo gulo]|uniref:Uncharacterized protein n=1 Tax=Gulo gulo TaxID=48420 RepID=A0A9X9M3T3_GULGU|nr:unnamed protein product [Gulo gulo]
MSISWDKNHFVLQKEIAKDRALVALRKLKRRTRLPPPGHSEKFKGFFHRKRVYALFFPYHNFCGLCQAVEVNIHINFSHI